MTNIATTVELRKIIREAANTVKTSSDFTSYTDKIDHEPTLRRVAVWFQHGSQAVADAANAKLAANGYANRVAATKSNYVRGVAIIPA